MKKLALLLMAAALSGCGAGIKTVVRGGFDASGRIAVMPFGGKDAETDLSLSEALTTYLMEAGFDVIERAQLEDVLREQKISLSGATNETIVKVGKLAGVNVVVTGAYRVRKENIRTETRHVDVPPLPRKPGGRQPGGVKQVTDSVRVETATIFSGLTVKFVDVNTGRVLISCSSEKDYDADSVDDALSDMAESIKKSLDKEKGER